MGMRPDVGGPRRPERVSREGIKVDAGLRGQVHMGNLGLIDNLILKGKNNTVLQSQHTFLGESHDQTIHREHEWRAIFRKYKQEGGT